MALFFLLFRLYFFLFFFTFFKHYVAFYVMHQKPNEIFSFLAVTGFPLWLSAIVTGLVCTFYTTLVMWQISDSQDCYLEFFIVKSSSSGFWFCLVIRLLFHFQPKVTFKWLIMQGPLFLIWLLTANTLFQVEEIEIKECRFMGSRF